MGQVQIDHGGGDLLVAEQALDRVEMGPGLQQVGGEAVGGPLGTGPLAENSGNELPSHSGLALPRSTFSNGCDS